jgi:hypothetical protein
MARGIFSGGLDGSEGHAVEFLTATVDALPWGDLIAGPVGPDAIGTVLKPAPRGTLRASVAP